MGQGPLVCPDPAEVGRVREPRSQRVPQPQRRQGSGCFLGTPVSEPEPPSAAGLLSRFPASLRSPVHLSLGQGHALEGPTGAGS